MKGIRHTFEFPRIGDLPWWSKILQYRAPKFTNNMANDEYALQRKFAAQSCRAHAQARARGVSALGEYLLFDQGFSAARDS